jgi:hypothetical protein
MTGHGWCQLIRNFELVAANCATHELASGLCEIEQTLACGGCKTMRHLDDTQVRGHTAEPDKTNASVCRWAPSQTLPVPRDPAPLSVALPHVHCRVLVRLAFHSCRL